MKDSKGTVSDVAPSSGSMVLSLDLRKVRLSISFLPGGYSLSAGYAGLWECVELIGKDLLN